MAGQDLPLREMTGDRLTGGVGRARASSTLVTTITTITTIGRERTGVG